MTLRHTNTHSPTQTHRPIPSLVEEDEVVEAEGEHRVNKNNFTNDREGERGGERRGVREREREVSPFHKSDAIDPLDCSGKLALKNTCDCLMFLLCECQQSRS